jgi:hypothetical protein
MSIFIAFLMVFLLFALLGLTLWSVVRAVSSDGLGHRPAPRSHEHDLDPRPWVAMFPR